jgi:hypothetical protein
MRSDDTVRLRLAAITLDPVRFQFKAGMNAEGVGLELAAVVKWEPDAEGVCAVWREPPRGKTFMVNGHHRYELAVRLQVADLRCRYLDAATDVEARVRGALINIREGRGDAIDAAKVFRDGGLSAGDLVRLGVAGERALEGLALAALDAALFRLVVLRRMPLARGILIGRELPEPAHQLGLVQLLDHHEQKGKFLADAEVVELIRQVRHAGTAQAAQVDLFGTHLLTNSLAVPRAQLGSYVRRRLAADKRTFGFVGRSDRAAVLETEGNEIKVAANSRRSLAAAQMLEMFDKLWTHPGPVSDAMTRGARQLAEGHFPDDVKIDAYQAIVPVLVASLRGVTPAPQDDVAWTLEVLRRLRSPVRLGRWKRESGLRTSPFRDAREELVRRGLVTKDGKGKAAIFTLAAAPGQRLLQ